MIGRVIRIEARGDGYCDVTCDVTISADQTYASVVQDDFKVEVGSTVEFEQDEDGNVHITDIGRSQ